MKTAEDWAMELTDKWKVGSSSQFCDETDWDSASTEELNAFIKQIQDDAFKAGMTEAAKIAKDKQIGCLTMTYKLACYEIHDAVLSARDRKESL